MIVGLCFGLIGKFGINDGDKGHVDPGIIDGIISRIGLVVQSSGRIENFGITGDEIVCSTGLVVVCLIWVG